MDNPHYVTPEEAEKMFCPMGMNYDGISEIPCAGQKCMAWRWKEIADWKEGSDLLVTYSTTHGYCGMVRSQ